MKTWLLTMLYYSWIKLFTLHKNENKINTRWKKTFEDNDIRQIRPLNVRFRYIVHKGESKPCTIAERSGKFYDLGPEGRELWNNNNDRRLLSSVTKS